MLILDSVNVPLHEGVALYHLHTFNTVIKNFLKNIIPYSSAEKLRDFLDDDDVDQNIFREEFDLDLSDDNAYAKINVPDFRDGRYGRFLHDFKNNQTAIIDESARRCFIMPLDRDAVLPPKSLADLILKMYTGYYDINPASIRKNMRVITPALTDLSTISSNIQKACESMDVYRLEKYISGGKCILCIRKLQWSINWIIMFAFYLQCSSAVLVYQPTESLPNSLETTSTTISWILINWIAHRRSMYSNLSRVQIAFEQWSHCWFIESILGTLW